PEAGVVEHMRKRAEGDIERLAGDVVHRHPLAYHPARFQALTKGSVVFFGVKVAHAGDARVDWVSGDHVELPVGHPEKIPAVIDPDIDLRTMQHPAGDLLEVLLGADHL